MASLDSCECARISGQSRMSEEDPLPFQRLIIGKDLEVTLTYYQESKGKTLKVRILRPSDPHNTLRLLTYWIRPEEVKTSGGTPEILMSSPSVQTTVDQTWEPMKT